MESGIDSQLPAALEWAQVIGLEEPGESPQVCPLAGEASGRRYFRLIWSDPSQGLNSPISKDLSLKSQVLMIGPDPRENRIWRDFGDRLGQKLRLPKIIAADEDRGFFLIEDLGEERLDRLVKISSPEERRDYYLLVARLLADWHAQALDLVQGSPCLNYNLDYTPEFAYQMEWGYFLRGLNFLDLTFDPSSLSEEGLRLSKIPCFPRIFIHRDFQSRNLIRFKGIFFALDWQGARIGPASYDLASLLWDPYVDLEDEVKTQCLEAYQTIRPEKHLAESLAMIAPLRLAQATGAYCHLAQRGLPYGPCLVPALTRLAKVLRDYPANSGFPNSLALIDQALEKARELYPWSPEEFS
ncbi:MAG: phosphotransferase [Deltaproteobacteria bacterium]|jgi:hypothetical protein|nr:phosphotransferase [Deltaproteobacteria bacterium]